MAKRFESPVRRMTRIEEGIIMTGHPYERSCAGYLFMHEGRAYDPDGLIEGVTTQEQVDAHNKTLSLAEIEGLDKNCQVGQGTFLYPKRSKPGAEFTHVTTWPGEIVAQLKLVERYRLEHRLTFERNGKTMVGITKKNEDSVWFKRVA